MSSSDATPPASDGSATAPEAGAPGPRKRKPLPLWLETIILLVIALVIASVIKTFFVQMFFVPSGSMEPLLKVNDRILVEKISYWTSPVQRGDVVVFQDPGGKWLGPLGHQRLNLLQDALSKIGLYPTTGHLVKRVIGVGGDEVACCDAQGRITVNGVPLDETSYLKPGADPSTMKFDVVVPPGRLWVMGDNRANSEDSRYHQKLPGGGTIPESLVVGKVWAIVWPWDHFSLVHRPATFDNPAARLLRGPRYDAQPLGIAGFQRLTPVAAIVAQRVGVPHPQTMEAAELRAIQAPLKDRYTADPASAMTPVHAAGDFSAPGLGTVVASWAGPITAGPHPSTGGSGAESCSADMLLQALVGCVGVTMRSVATVMRIPIASAQLTAHGTFDARGTLGVDPHAPVGVQDVVVDAVVETDADQEKLDRLAVLSHRYCVVGQSLLGGFEIRITARPG